MLIDVIVLAAGKGTRMRSNLPKVLHPIAGKEMLRHVLDAVPHYDEMTTTVVVGHGADIVKDRFAATELNFAEQTEQLGTGHAVMAAESHIRDDATALILMGDVPLIKRATLDSLVEASKSTGFSLLTLTLDNPFGYGRILRDSQGDVTGIVEEKDASDQQRLVQEVNTGIMAIKGDLLKRWLKGLSSNNAQGEYYLTDVVALAVAEGVMINTQQASSLDEVMGVNNRRQQAELERSFQMSVANNLLDNGMTLADPSRIDVRGNLAHGNDCFIDVNCVFEGDVVFGDNVVIESNCVIKNATIGANTVVKANSCIEESTLAGDNDIGPFARLRPGSELALKAKIGNFVETKKAIIGEGSKVNHLSYVGDAELGTGVNVGAGTITCNYDGVNKHKTVIGDDAFVGSNSTLVAPLNVGNGGFVGAGSVITKEVSSQSLALSRAKQRELKDWVSPKKRKDS